MEYKGTFKPKTAARMLLVIGIIVTFISAITFYYVCQDGIYRVHCTESCVGTVISVKEHKTTTAYKTGRVHSKSSYEYATEYNYVVNGREYRGSSTLTEKEKLNVGDAITVYYDPDHPYTDFSEYDEIYTSTAYFIAMLVLFAALLAGGIALIVTGVKIKKQYASQDSKPKGKGNGRPRGSVKGQQRKGKQHSKGRTKGGKEIIKW